MNDIVFVDDEPDILEGLRNALRSHRKRWSMRFALGAEAALRELEAGPCDLVVTDVRMPVVDGVALLETVRARWPHVARIVLSGHADCAIAARATAVAHQYVLKPCDAGSLSAVVTRTLALVQAASSPRLRALVCGVGALPSTSRAHGALAAALGEAGCDAKRAAAIVRLDMGLAARVLQFVNSAYCGLSRRIAGVESAVEHLGVDVLRHLLPTVEVPGDGPVAAELEEARRHAALAARIARRLAPPESADAAYAAALLHDTGKVVLLADRWARARASAPPPADAELSREVHAEAGACLLALWDLPPEIVGAVQSHHALDAVGKSGLDTLAIVTLADALAHEVGGGVHGRGVVERLAGLGDVGRWREVARAEAEAALAA